MSHKSPNAFKLKLLKIVVDKSHKNLKIIWPVHVVLKRINGNITEGFQPSQNIIEKWWIYSFVYLLATKPINKWSKASGQSLEGLWVENRAEI